MQRSRGTLRYTLLFPLNPYPPPPPPRALCALCSSTPSTCTLRSSTSPGRRSLAASPRSLCPSCRCVRVRAFPRCVRSRVYMAVVQAGGAGLHYRAFQTPMCRTTGPLGCHQARHQPDSQGHLFKRTTLPIQIPFCHPTHRRLSRLPLSAPPPWGPRPSPPRWRRRAWAERRAARR